MGLIRVLPKNKEAVMSVSLNCALQAVENYKDTILAAERHIWNNPESGYKEWKTHAYLKEKFEKLGYTVTDAGNIPGFWADIDTGRPGPTVAVFGELDSLIVPTHPECDPETGAVHACGHHCQCAALLGVAAGLAAPGTLDELSGKIRLIAVPAEELIEIGFRKQLKEQGIIRYFGGKQEFMYRGVLDGVDMSFMVHTGGGTGLSCGAGSNGCVIKEATFIGKPAHAGGAPHAGINALYAANCGMQAANALRETFKDDEHIRFHPITTQGGVAVNAIPDHVVTESYVRGATTQAIIRENTKLNRAFAGAAAAMGCQLQLWDHHGYAPRESDPTLKEVLRQAGMEILGEEQIRFDNGWATGCSDMGDVCCVMPGLHPTIGGAQGAAHSNAYYIVDPVTACVNSAKIQLTALVRLLEKDCAGAKQVLANGRQDYPTIPEYLAEIDKLCIDKQAVIYNEDGTVTLDF